MSGAPSRRGRSILYRAPAFAVPAALVLALAPVACARTSVPADPQDLVRGLDADSPAARLASSRALVEAGAGALPAVRPAMGSESWLLRAEVAGVLGGIGAPAVADLQAMLADEDERVRGQVVKQLDAIDDPSTAEPLRDALGDRAPGIRWLAVRGLGDLGAAAEPAVPALREAMRDPSRLVRVRVATTLAEIGAPAVAALRDGLADDDADVRQRAAWALGQIGAAAAVAVPDLERALADPNPDVREQAGFALELLRPRDGEAP